MKKVKKLFKKSKGFTLIEMLVVVLIIGILASIALPRYQMAVMKAKLAQLDIVFGTLSRHIDLYLDVNDFSDDWVYFTGQKSVSDIELPGDCSSDTRCEIDSTSRFEANCFDNICEIGFYRDNWGQISYYRNRDIGKFWYIAYVSDEDKKVVCQWVKGRNYKVNTRVAGDCEDVGVVFEESISD